VAILPLDLAYCGIVTHSGEILTTEKSHKKSFKGRYPLSSKIEIYNKVIKQVNSFIYLGNFISFEKEVDSDNTLNKYLKLVGVIYNNFIPHKTLKKTRM